MAAYGRIIAVFKFTLRIESRPAGISRAVNFASQAIFAFKCVLDPLPVNQIGDIA